MALKSDFGLFQKCDRSSFTGDTVTCRRFPSRSQDCESKVGRILWQEKIFSGEELSALETQGVLAGSVETWEKRARLGHEDDDEAWSFCESWETAG